MPDFTIDAGASTAPTDPAADQGNQRLLEALARAQQVALLASRDLATAAAGLGVALRKRGCEVLAALETQDTESIATPSTSSNSFSLDAVVVLGDTPAMPEDWGRSGPFRAVAACAVKGVAEGVPTYSIGGLKGPAVVAWLTQEVAKLPDVDSSAGAARWAEAAAAVRGNAADNVRRCLAQWPEMRAARDKSDGGQGGTLLHLAAGAAAHTALGVLLQTGAAWHVQDKRMLTAGEIALTAGHQECFELLVARATASERADRADRGDDDGPAPKRRRGAEGQAYLQQQLRYETGRLIDANGRGVMMGWEAPLMAKHAMALLPTGCGGDVLNIGFGLGLVDGFLQDQHPQSHTIVEAHPDVFAEMQRRGWNDRKGVKVYHGRWQDVLDGLPAASFDAIFFDTYEETYLDLHAFMAHLPRLLRPGGRFSYFNGLAPYNIFYHAVYCRMAQVDLDILGLPCDFLPIEIGSLGDSTWHGIMERYWQFETYYLPLAIFHRAGLNGQADKSGWRRWPAYPVKAGDNIGREDLIPVPHSPTWSPDTDSNHSCNDGDGGGGCLGESG